MNYVYAFICAAIFCYSFYMTMWYATYEWKGGNLLPVSSQVVMGIFWGLITIGSGIGLFVVLP